MNISKIVQNAKCLVLGATVTTLGLSAGAAASEGVQLWEGGPYWATVNLGTSEVQDHPEYGALYTFDEAGAAVKSLLGEEWRVPTKEELEKLCGEIPGYCTMTLGSTKKGYTFTGTTAGYTDKSIYLPIAGYDAAGSRGHAGEYGHYWSSVERDDERAYNFAVHGSFAHTDYTYRFYGCSVRAVRDTAPVTGPSVTVGEVTSGEPWSTITVNYTLGGTDATLDYKVAFDVTAGGQTASVTNDAAKLTDGAAMKVIDTAQLFGKQVADAKAKVKVSLIAIKPKDLEGAQLGTGDAAEGEVVAFGEQEFWLGGDEVAVAAGEGGFWLGPDEIVVASGEKEFALTAFRELPENPTAKDVRAAIEASGAKDKSRILALINDAADPVAAYRAFNAWAQGVGAVAVANSDHAGDSYAFGVEELFEHEPDVQISDVAVDTGKSGAMTIAVTVKDGDTPKRVASAKVAEMFEATSDLSDWNGKGKLTPTVTDRTKAVATPVEYTVTPGDGTAEKAFLRIRK